MDNESEVLSGDHIDPPDEEEIQYALVKLKNNKAPGIDDIPAEHGGQELVLFLICPTFIRHGY